MDLLYWKDFMAKLSKSDGRVESLDFHGSKYIRPPLLESFTDFIGNLAVVTTIFQFLSGALVCKQYVVNRSTGEATPLPFVCSILSCGLWLFYGITNADDKIVLVNLVGIALMSWYTIVFYIFTFKKSVVIKQCLATALVLFFVMLFATKETNKEYLLNVLGILASIFTLVTIAAPMSKLVYVIKVKNTECLPFPLIFMSFLVSGLWMCYGCLIQDTFLQYVNAVGTLLATAQLWLFLIYPSIPQSPILPKHI